ncbi:MAG: CaiB/BaiF CoA-transferase family protein [Deferribacterota bacterium]|nr:CaiB/BaiF CoA-transferase family protein [Deferribacterota bacterium]
MEALEGIKILDLGRLLPFEYTTVILGDLGADILKIEEPGRGDYMRDMPPKNKKENIIFLMLNRNKKSMTLDLKKEKGKEIFLDLVKKYDVVFEGFRPKVMEKLGLGYERLKEVNPKLIYCAATGYGQYGSYSKKPGHDINYISIAGILGKTGLDKPVIPGIPIADMTIGVYSALSILAAIIARGKSGEGQYIDISMTDCMLSYNIVNIASYLVESKNMPILDLRGGLPNYNVYETKDGKYISMGNLEYKFWKNFCETVGRKDLIEEYASNIIEEKKENLREEIQKIFKEKNRDEWIELFEGVDTCITPVYSIQETLEDRLFKEREMIMEVDHPIEGKVKQIALPIKFSKTKQKIKSYSPMLGEHTELILKSLGYNEKEISYLKENKIV